MSTREACCLTCGHKDTEESHFPLHVGMGRNKKKVTQYLPTIRQCRRCHVALGQGEAWVWELAAARAPSYWKAVGEWEKARPVFETWLAKRQLKRSSSRS